MKNRILLGSVLLAAAMSSCGSYNTSVSVGAVVGGIIGSVIGEQAGGYQGSDIGSAVGMLAGAAVGDALAKPPKEEVWVIETVDSDYQPSTLRVTNLRFIDGNRNRIIDASEECKLLFEIENLGELPVYNITPVVEEVTGMKHLQLSPSGRISALQPGTRVQYTAVIKGKKRLKTGEAIFQVYATDGTGIVSDAHEFSLPTAEKP